MTRRGKIIGASAALLLVLVAALGWRSDGASTVTESTERSNYYFRLKASYTHDGDPVDFDVVVACGIRVDRYKSGDSGFFAARYPRFFVKETHDGHAVMQIVPIACRGETTQSGIVPQDFLPGVIWLDKPGDYRFGVAYVSEDAFENSNSQLQFLGASIEKATHEDWSAFRKRAAENEGMRQRYYDRPIYSTTDAQRIASAKGHEIEAAHARNCHGVVRFRLSAAGRNAMRKYWPAGKPEFWIDGKNNGAWAALDRLRKTTAIFANGFRYSEQLNNGNYRYGGFPTRARGGMFHSRSRPLVPSDMFPTRFDRGAPWVFSDEVANSPYLTKNVEARTGPGKGFLYCYTILNPGEGKLEVPIPNFEGRESRIRVDDKWLVTPEPLFWSWPNRFYERDEYMYVKFNAGLS